MPTHFSDAMMMRTAPELIPESKLPQQGTTIFSTMTALAQRLNALNLSQGFPDFAAPRELTELLAQATQSGHNQYAAGDGLLRLREQVAQQFAQRDQIQVDPIQEITIVPGATIALFCAIQALIHPDDEVIIFDPCYDSYAPAVRLAGGRCIHIALNAHDFSVDWQQVADAISPKTKMVIVNTPHNPTGTMWQQTDWQQLIQLILDKPIYVLSDEVYEHLCFDQQRHYSAWSFPELRARSLVVGSFGKTFHVTGWKTGYCVAAPQLMQLFRQIYQFTSFCGNTPCQVALSEYMQRHPEHIQNLSAFYQNKRDDFLTALSGSSWQWQPAAGTYFQVLDYSQIRPDLNAAEMCEYLAHEYKIVGIPVSAFYQKTPEQQRLIRFCFAKTEQTLAQATAILAQIK